MSNIKQLVDRQLQAQESFQTPKPTINLSRKKSLGHRLEVLKVLLRRFLNDPACRAMVNFTGPSLITDKVVENYLDSELLNFDYELEEMITMYKHYTPEPNTEPSQCKKCGYNKPFCGCNAKEGKQCKKHLSNT